MRRVAMLAALLGAGCGGTPPPEPPDPTLARQTRTAMLAWQQDRPAQAAALFRDALQRAYARDDIDAIADLAASLAASELRLGNAEAARDTAAAARTEVARRGATLPDFWTRRFLDFFIQKYNTKRQQNTMKKIRQR